MKVFVTEEPLNLASLHGELATKAAGATLVFTGVVRDHNKGEQVEYIDYEAYPEMARKQLLALAESAQRKFELVDVVFVHRLGRLHVGEVIVFIGVSAAHRQEAYEGSRFLIEELKKIVPIWKREVGPAIDHWIEGDELVDAGTEAEHG